MDAPKARSGPARGLPAIVYNRAKMLAKYISYVRK